MTQTKNITMKIMCQSILIWLSAMMIAEASMAQVGIGTASPNASAALEISATNKALLLPRLTTAQRDNIATPVAGMLIYNASTAKFQGYTGASSSSIMATSSIALTTTNIDGDNYAAQTFQVSEPCAQVNISFWVQSMDNGFSSGNVMVELRTGNPNSASTLLGTQSTVVNATGKVTVTISSLSLLTGTTYHFLIKPTTSFSAGNIRLSRSNGSTPGEYSGGSVWYYQLNMGSWYDSGVDDLKFEVVKSAGGWVDLH